MTVFYDHSTLLGSFKVRGEDALSFLQGQSTPDLRKISEGEVVFAGFLDPKGRVLANGWIALESDTFTIILSKDLEETTRERLRRHILRSKVIVDPPESESSLWIGISKNASRSGSTTQNRYASLDSGFRLETATGILICGGTGPVFPGNSKRMDTMDRLALIMAGIPLVTSRTTQCFIPQMLGMDRLGSLSFEKGCYIGQEVVTRVQFLGAVKRHLCRFISDQDVEAAPGAEIRNDTDPEALGTVLSSAVIAGRKCVGLCVIKDLEHHQGPMSINKHPIECAVTESLFEDKVWDWLQPFTAD